jgi:hypothetical protein
MAPTLADLCTSPDHYLHSFDGDDAVFIAMDRAAYRRSIFLDHRISPAAEGATRVPVQALVERLPEPQPLRWIFHIAHCGSTLLARALDELGGGLVLREPLALRQAAIEPSAARLRLVLAMLGKRYPDGLPTLVKANVPVNFILPEIAAADPQAPAIVLYLTLRDYCFAILRSEQHRGWLRQVTTLLAPHLTRFDPARDGARAAALWLAQTERFAAALGTMPNAQSLEGERFYAEPAAVLGAAGALLGRAHEFDRVATLTTGPVFARHSKRPGVAFDNSARLAERARLADALAPELADAEAWIAQHEPEARRALNALAHRRL